MKEKVKHMVTPDGEQLLLGTGFKYPVGINKPVYRRISIDKIEILDDTDFFTKGEFIFRLLVDGVDAGLSAVKYANSEEMTDYGFSLAVKHYPLTPSGEENPLGIEFRADELERFGANEKVARFKVTHSKDDRFGISSAPKPLKNKYICVYYSIEKLSRDAFDSYERISGEVYTHENGSRKAMSNSRVQIFEKRLSPAMPFNMKSGPNDGNIADNTTTDTQGKFTLTNLDVDCSYRLRISAPGHADSEHEISILHQSIAVPLEKIFLGGTILNSQNKPVKDVRIKLFKTRLRIKQQLKCFFEPNTKSPVKKIKGATSVRLDSGKHPVLGTHISAGNHWAKIKSDKIPISTGWICFRSGSTNYANINSTKKEITLTKKLKVFHNHDTKTPIDVPNLEDVKIETGDYDVCELVTSKETDFFRIHSEKLPYDRSWVCARWKEGSSDKFGGVLYDEMIDDNAAQTDDKGNFLISDLDKDGVLYRIATFHSGYYDSQSKRIKPSTKKELRSIEIRLDTMIGDSMIESNITNLLSDWSNYVYATPARYPYDSIAGYSVTKASSAANKRTVCCPFVEGIVVKAWHDSHPSFAWNGDRHGQFMITDIRSDKYSPITALIELDIADEIDSNDVPPPWTVIQGWTDNPNKTNSAGDYVYPLDSLPSGHTYIIVDVQPHTQRVLTLEATSYAGQNGPGFRKLGHIDNHTNCCPGEKWWDNSSLWNWERFKSNHKERKLARLHINKIVWVK